MQIYAMRRRGSPLSRLTTPSKNLHGRFFLLRLYSRCRHRAVSIPRALDVDLGAVLQRRAGAVLERRRRAGADREPVHAEADRRARALEAPHRALDLELSAGRVVVDLDFARVDRAVRLTITHDMQ